MHPDPVHEPQTAGRPEQLAELFASRHATRFLHLSQDFLVVGDLEGRFRMFNQALCDRLGYAQEEMLARPFIEFVHPDDRSATLQALASLGEGRNVVDFENRYRRKAGDYVWMQWRSGPADEDGLVYATARDVTEKRQGERMRARMGEVLRRTSDIVAIFDPTGQATFFNRAGRALLGLEEEIDGLALIDCVPEEQRAAFETEILAAVHREGIWSGDAELSSADGSGIPVSMVLLSHPSDSGGRDAYSIVARDLRETRHLQAQIHHGQRLESIGRLAGGVAHDFHNLLTVIQGYVELIGMDAQSKPFAGPLEAIRAASERAAELTMQLLAFSRRQVVDLAVVDPAQQVQAAGDLLHRVLGAHIELVLRIAASCWPVRINPSQLEQIVVNLAVNARDAMPDGGTLTLELANRVIGAAEARRLPEVVPGDYVQLRVRDTGHGMSVAVLERAFEPFFTTKDVDKGTGLGLATCHGIVKQIGGHIWVESEVGRGTVFSILLPRIDAAVSCETRTEERVRRGAEGILVLEDEGRVRQLAVHALERLGYRVFAAADGAEAAEIARVHGAGIELLLADVVLPRQSGLSVAAQLRAEIPGLKVVYCSGYTEDTVLEHGVRDREVHFLAKPYTIADLGRVVRCVLDG